jgi:hypothetical protein
VNGQLRSYYGRPVIKEPVWTWEIPCYFFTGGLAGASSVLSLSAKLFGNEKLSRTALYVGAVADAASPVLLVSDLGRPERFHHMLRVFKVTSPMNVGAWVLLVSGGASNAAALLERLGRLPRLKAAAEIVAALAGPPLATYTGVLVADTAVPVWHEGRQELPWLFGASAAASAGAAACLFLRPRHARPARRLAVGGVLAEGVAMHAMELRLGEVGEVYHRGEAGVGGEGARVGGRAPARAPRRTQPFRRRDRRRARLRRRALSALVGVQGGIPVGSRSQVHRRPAARARGPRRRQGDDDAGPAGRQGFPRHLNGAARRT